jgi:tetratricopeptide (TPR) repeat protein
VIPSQIDKFEIRDRLGRGGMGIVYLGYDPGLDRLVAIKVLREEFRSDPELRARFLREARAVASMKHSTNVVVIHATGIDQTEGPFMAMEYIAGDTLKTLLSAADVPPLLRRLELMEGLCNGLAHAHRYNIIHRDIKPANLIVDSDGVLKILDFGIARVDGSNTLSGVIGTFSYMSPEQAAGTEIDKRSDVFAAGSVLYETIALRQAFPGEGFAPLNRIRDVDYVPIEKVVDGIDSELADIVRQALQLRPGDRYPSMGDMWQAVRRCRERLAHHTDAAGASFETVVRPLNRAEDSGAGLGRDGRRRAGQQRQSGETDIEAAREALGLGDFDKARELAERALMSAPDDRTARETLERVRYAQDARRIRQLTAEARDHLARGRLDEAFRIARSAADAAQALPDIGTAADVRAEVRNCLEEVRASNERERAIAAALERARAALGNSGFDTALRAVYEVLALDPSRSEAWELERIAQRSLQQQREAAQRVRNDLAQIDAAVGSAHAGRFDEALAPLGALLTNDDAGVQAAATDAKAQVVALQQKAAHARSLDQARQALQRGDVIAAATAIDAIPDDGLTASGRELRASIAAGLEQQRERERRRQAVDDLVWTVRKLLDRGAYEEAQLRLQRNQDVDPDDARIVDLRKRIEQGRASVEARRRGEERDRRAATQVDVARARAESGEVDAAITQLETFGSEHPLVAAALDKLHGERASASAHRRAEERIAGLVQTARTRAADGNVDGALALLAREDAAHPAVAAALAELQSVKAAADVMYALSSAAEALSGADYDAAERRVRDALAIESGNQEALALKVRIAEARAVSARTKNSRWQESRAAEPQPVRPPLLSRARVGAAMGLAALAIVFAVLIVIWWREASSPNLTASQNDGKATAEPHNPDTREMSEGKPPVQPHSGSTLPEPPQKIDSPKTPPRREDGDEASGTGSNKQREDERITALVQQAMTRAAAGDDDGAIRLLEHEEQGHPLVTAALARLKALKAAVARAAQAVAGADYDAATRSVDEALAIDPNHREALRLKSRIADELARSEEAKEEAVKAAARATAVRGAVSRATNALTLRDYEAATRAVDEALAIEPKHTEALRLKGRIADELAKSDAVKAALGRATRALTLRDYEAATRAVDEALATEPKHSEALRLKALIADERAKLDMDTATKLVAEFAAVIQRRESAGFSQIVPGASNAQKAWIRELQKEYKKCDAQLSVSAIPVNGPTEATVQASGRGLCEPNVGRDKLDLPTTYSFRVVKSAAGRWRIDGYTTD